MGDYFKILNSTDPLIHSLVVSRLKEMEEREALSDLSISDFTEQDELEILRVYCSTLHKEYRTLRTILLENMQVSSKTVGMKHSSN
jgi:hypothetical protein